MKGIRLLVVLLAIWLTLACLWGCVMPPPVAAPVPSSAPTARESSPVQPPAVSRTAPPSTEKAAPAVVNWRDAGNFLGEVKTLEGVIMTARWAYNSNGKPTFLNFNDPYKGYLTCVIWGEDRLKFPPSPEKYYLKKRVQVTGLIKSYQDAPEIILTEASQIKVLE
jgi:hypothetical protein